MDTSPGNTPYNVFRVFRVPVEPEAARVLNASTATGQTTVSESNRSQSPVVCAWRPRTLRPSRHQPGIAPHDLSLWWAIGSNSIAIPAHVTSHDGKRIPVTAAFYRARSPWTLRFSALRYALARLHHRCSSFGALTQSAHFVQQALTAYSSTNRHAWGHNGAPIGVAPAALSSTGKVW